MGPAIAIGAFVVLIVIFAILGRNNTLEKMPMIEGEQVVHEESEVLVQQMYGRRVTTYARCVARLTDRRLILAQKALFGGHVLRYIVHTRNHQSAEAGLKLGYLELTVRPGEVTFTEHEGKPVMTIPLGSVTMAGGQELRLSPASAEPYKKAFAP